MIVAGAMTVMLGLALVVALAREHGDDRIRDPDELVGVGIGHPLATVPTDEASIQLQQVPPAGYRLLLTMIANQETTGSAVVCVLGTDAPQAAMAVSAGLAASAHRLGRRTLLVGTPCPQQWNDARAIPVDELETSGLSSAPTAPTMLSLGSEEVDVEQFVLSSSLGPALERAGHSFDVVVLFGGSGTSATGRRFAELADLTLVVATLDQDDFVAVLGLVETLQQSGVENLSLVAAKPPGAVPVRWRDTGPTNAAAVRTAFGPETARARRRGRRAVTPRPQGTADRLDQRLAP
jgi:hypothetical protein